MIAYWYLAFPSEKIAEPKPHETAIRCSSVISTRTGVLAYAALAEIGPGLVEVNHFEPFGAVKVTVPEKFPGQLPLVPAPAL